MAPTTYMNAVASSFGITRKSLVALPAKYSVNTTVRGRKHPLTAAALLGASWHSSSSCKSRSHIRKRVVTLSSSDRDSDLVDTLRDDLERLQSKQQARLKDLGKQLPEANDESNDGFIGSLKQTVDKVLIADFFFVLLALAWLAAGVGEKSTFNSTKLLDAWYPLWMLVFQPAIGVLMLGALVSGAAGWLKTKSSA
ncbi:TPA: hypothetical protein ACH3X3_006181 [Trebouxia sp. C0006]